MFDYDNRAPYFVQLYTYQCTNLYTSFHTSKRKKCKIQKPCLCPYNSLYAMFPKLGAIVNISAYVFAPGDLCICDISMYLSSTLWHHLSVMMPVVLDQFHQFHMHNISDYVSEQPIVFSFTSPENIASILIGFRFEIQL